MQAISLSPSSGNPHHQLALLQASYSGDELVAIYRYFRSLEVDNPFSTARENLIIAFEKVPLFRLNPTIMCQWAVVRLGQQINFLFPEQQFPSLHTQSENHRSVQEYQVLDHLKRYQEQQQLLKKANHQSGRCQSSSIAESLLGMVVSLYEITIVDDGFFSSLVVENGDHW